MEQCRLALETDPLSMILHTGMAISLYYARQYREAIEYARRSLEIDANYYLIWYAIGRCQLGAGFPKDAIARFKRVVDLAPWYFEGAWFLATAYLQAGDRERSQELARKLADSHGHTFGAAWYYAAAGEVDAMFEALNGAYRQRDPSLPLFQNEPVVDPYRSDPRFQSLLRRMNLAPVQ
jgi:tetratricopeptide (TPR) repeat protein